MAYSAEKTLPVAWLDEKVKSKMKHPSDMLMPRFELMLLVTRGPTCYQLDNRVARERERERVFCCGSFYLFISLFLHPTNIYVKSLQATSKLLLNYAEPYKTQVLDYLFKVHEWHF